MFICPTCSKEFLTEPEVVKHFLKCWKEHNPHHESKEAPHSPDIVNKQVNADTLAFFAKYES